MEFTLKSVKPAVPVFVRYLRDGTEYVTMAYVDYAFDTVEFSDPQVFAGVEDGQDIESFKRAILASMDYDPSNVSVQAVPQMAWAEIAKIRSGEYKSIFKEHNSFGPGPATKGE